MNEQADKRRGYNVVAKRLDSGEYTLSYGRGSKKLACIVKNVQGTWLIQSGDEMPGDITSKVFRDIKEAWGRWAEQTYHGVLPPEDVTPGQPPQQRYVPVEDEAADDAEYIAGEPDRQAKREWTYIESATLGRLVSMFGKERLIQKINEL